MKIKVLMVGPASLGGISSLIRTILPLLEKMIPIQFFATVTSREPVKAGKISIGNIYIAFSQYVRFILTLLKYRPNIIHLHTSQSIAWLKDTFYVIVSKMLGIRVILHFHASDFDKFYAKTPSIMQHYTRWMINRVDAIICVSESWKNTIDQIVPPARVHKYINCINVNDVQAHRNGADDHKVTALFLGAVGNRKGVPELLDAMSLIKSKNLPLHLWIAGSAEKLGDLEIARDKINQLQLQENCELLGDVREQKKSELLETADIFVLPSYHEGLPIALLESMASGMAIITTPVGGIPEIITDGYNGFLVEPGNVTALAEKLALLTNDPHLCRKMGSINREFADKEVNAKNYVKKLAQLYEDISSIDL